MGPYEDWKMCFFEFLFFLSVLTIIGGCVGDIVVKHEFLSNTDVSQFYTKVTESKFVKYSKPCTIISIVLIPFCVICCVGMVLMMFLAINSNDHAHGPGKLLDILVGFVVGCFALVVVGLLVASVVLTSKGLKQESTDICENFSHHTNYSELSDDDISFVEKLIGSPMTEESFQRWVFDHCYKNYGKDWVFLVLRFQFFFCLVIIPLIILVVYFFVGCDH